MGFYMKRKVLSELTRFVTRGANETRQLTSYSNSIRSKLDSSELDSKC